MSDQNRLILRKIPLFRDFDDSQCDATIAVLAVREFAPGEAVFHQGQTGDTMVIVVSGHLRVELEDGRGGRSPLGSVGPGEIVGEMAVLDPAPRSCTVTAVSETVVYELHREGLRQLRHAAPNASAAIVSAVISDVTRRLRQINKQIDALLNPRQSGSFQAAPVGAPAPARATAETETPSLFSRIWSLLTGD